MVITIPFYQIKLHCLQEMMRVLESVSVKRRKRRRAWRSDGAALRISWRLWRNAEIRLRMLRMRTIQKKQRRKRIPSRLQIMSGFSSDATLRLHITFITTTIQTIHTVLYALDRTKFNLLPSTQNSRAEATVTYTHIVHSVTIGCVAVSRWLDREAEKGGKFGSYRFDGKPR